MIKHRTLNIYSGSIGAIIIQKVDPAMTRSARTEGTTRSRRDTPSRVMSAEAIAWNSSKNASYSVRRERSLERE